MRQNLLVKPSDKKYLILWYECDNFRPLTVPVSTLREWKKFCKFTTLELRMWNNKTQIGMLWDKNVDLVIEKSLVIKKNNVIHKPRK